MNDTNKLMEDEINRLKQEDIVELEEEINLEELILLGDEKKIPIIISYPREDGTRIRAKALVKQLTLKELSQIQVPRNNALEASINVLTEALFKQNGDNFTEEELLVLPIGVVNAISDKILELSGVDRSTQNLRDF